MAFAPLGVSPIGAPAGSAPGTAATLYKLQAAGAPTDGVTGAGTVDNGELYRDTTNNVIYQNIGTLGSPVYSGIVQS